MVTINSLIKAYKFVNILPEKNMLLRNNMGNDYFEGVESHGVNESRGVSDCLDWNGI